MNERIKLLAEQAGWDSHHSKFDTRIEKFSELIVQQCIAIVDKYGDSDEGNHIAYQIEQHFGVEE